MERQYYSQKKKVQRRSIGQASQELNRREEDRDNSWRRYLHEIRGNQNSQEVEPNRLTQNNEPGNANIEYFLNIPRQRIVMILAIVSVVFFSLLVFSRDYTQEQCYLLYRQLKCEYQNLTSECQKYYACFQDESKRSPQIFDKISKAIIGCVVALIVKICHRYIPILRVIVH